ncbi:tyrosine-type recombinase/integrase [Chloroflexota bacterium]
MPSYSSRLVPHEQDWTSWFTERQIGARGINPHRLRDAFATRAFELDGSNTSLRLLQEHLGHQSIATTMKYRKLSGDEHRDWYQRFCNTGSA